MANHVRRQLREAVAAAVTGLASTAGRVSESRVYPLTDLPALRVSVNDEAAQALSVSAPLSYQREVEVLVEAVARAAADVDDALDQMQLEVETALAGGVSLGGKHVDLIYAGASIEMSADAEQPTGQVSLRFTAQLFTAAAAPDVAL